MERFSGFSSKDFAQVNSITVPPKVGSTAWGSYSKARAHAPDDASLFSSSLPVLPLEKPKLDNLDHRVDATGIASISMPQIHQDGEIKGSDEDIDQVVIGSLLPDDEDELLAGMMGEFDLNDLPSRVEDLDDYDLFQNGGVIELDFQPQEKFNFCFGKASISDNYTANGLSNGMGAIVGEHPLGEHPSRTLFVRNINSNVDDSELRSLFEQFGAIRSLYSACKHRGFVMISYYDIRDARTAMRTLQNKPLCGRKLDIHFSIPKDNPSDKDMNQGTLVIFNLDPSVSNSDLRQIFGAYGEIKEIRETPHRKHHKFIEFYDVRAADAALKSLNRSDIAGKRIKLEPSRPGGARRNMIQQLSQDLDQDETRSYRFQVGSPIGNSPPGNWPQYHPNEGSTLHSLGHSSSFGTVSPIGSNHLLGLASILSPPSSNPVKIAPIGKDQGRNNHAEQVFSSNNSFGEAGFPHARSFPNNACGLMPTMNSVPGLLTSSRASDMGTLTGPQFLWGSPTPFSEHIHSSTCPAPAFGSSLISNGHGHGHSCMSQQTSLTSSSSHHQYNVGSAPSGIPFERHHGFFPKSPETTYMNALSLGGGLNQNEGGYIMNIGNRSAMHSGVGLPSNVMPANGSPSVQVFPAHRMGHFVRGSSPFPGLFAGIDVMVDHGRSRSENSVSQLGSKKQYQLHLDKIVSGEDTRTTLMIKNIPNKYTSKMLLATIDENHKGAYDFFYLPIDFKNKCNVGYAFINMVTPAHIIPFYEAFNGKKWEKFNSEKVASLAYARIQGKSALVNHFQNSSLMTEDKRCRPILFHSDGTEAGGQEPFPLNNLIIRAHPLDPSYSENFSGSPAMVHGSEKNEKCDE